MNAEGVPKLLDFGIAKLLTSVSGASETVTRAGMLTPEFASPEQMRGESVYESADVYALGVLLYRLLAGQSPYRVSDRSAARTGASDLRGRTRATEHGTGNREHVRVPGSRLFDTRTG